MALARLMHKPITVFAKFVMRQTINGAAQDKAAYRQRYSICNLLPMEFADTVSGCSVEMILLSCRFLL